MKSNIYIYIDGSCNNLKKTSGQWSLVMIDKNKKILKIRTEILISKNQSYTSSQMELIALLETLKFFVKELKKKSSCTIYSDSQYVCNIYNEINKFNIHGNIWEEIFNLKRKNILVKWVRGHSDCIGNIIAHNVMEKVRHNLKKLI